MSLHTEFESWEDLIEHLKYSDPPKCLTVNYLPDENKYEMWIGNQPYYTYEQLIELEEIENQKLRKENKHLRETLDRILVAAKNALQLSKDV